MEEAELEQTGTTQSFRLDGIYTRQLCVSATTVGAFGRVTLAGAAGPASHETLDILLQRFHVRCVQTGVREVTVDMLGLELLDAESFQSFVTWASGLRELDVGLQYKLVFLSSAAKSWQRLCLRSLAGVAVDLITIQAVV